MTEPAPLSLSLPSVRRSLMRVADGTGDELDPELEAIRARGMAEIMAARWSSTMPSRYASATWDRITDAANRDALQKWSVLSKPTNLVLLGSPGTGKTSAATVALRAAFDACLEVRFAGARSLLNDLQPDGPPGALADYCEVDRLLVDDVGKEKPSQWTVEQLDHIISVRYNQERPVVVTSNFNAGDLKAHLGAHAASRLFGDGATLVVMRGDDRRKP